MNWPLLRNRLVNRHHEEPQKTAQIDHAISLLREAHGLLAQMGHFIYLTEGPAIAPPEWPKLVFHAQKAPRGFLALCPEDFELLGDGWYDTLDEAKHAQGMEVQQRRGGIFPRSGLPALVAGSEQTELDKERDHG